MNASLRRIVLLSAALGLSPGAARAADPLAPPPITSPLAKFVVPKPGAAKATEAKVADPFDPIRMRIDQMLKARVNPEPLPAVLPNPFTLPNAPTALAIEDDLAPVNPQTPVAAPEGPEPGSDMETLMRFAATLKIGGMVALNGQTSLYINQLLYKEGDVILMEKRDPKSAVKVIRIGPAGLTLGYNEAQHTVRLKN